MTCSCSPNAWNRLLARPVHGEKARCSNCGHLLTEHENGRCTHYMVSDHGYWLDPICSCVALPYKDVTEVAEFMREKSEAI